MKCPECKSDHINKNGHRGQKQNYICVNCGRQFTVYERVTGVSRTTIMDWVKQVGKLLPDSYNPETIPEVGELDELETFVGQKKNKIWLGTAVDHFRDGILGWVIGDYSAETFQRLWQAISFWQCYFWVSDGNPVYPIFIPNGDQIVSKTYRTRVEGENTRLSHYNRPSSSSDSLLFKMCQNVRKFPTASNSLP